MTAVFRGTTPGTMGGIRHSRICPGVPNSGAAETPGTGVLVPSFVVSAAHDQAAIAHTVNADAGLPPDPPERHRDCTARSIGAAGPEITRMRKFKLLA